jgi:DNA repair exonuclease SbcCD ATPase subunit
MIVFHKIRYKNFLSTGNVFTEIALDRHKTTLIVGENGAGKSTVLDALSYALYGRAFRNINKPQLINSINRKGLLVELEFTVGKKTYMIRRGIKPSVFEIYQSGKILDQHAESKEHQEMLEKTILKLSHKAFSQIVILGSASFVPFMQLTAANRREIIEDLLDIGIFSTMNSLLKDKIQANNTDVINIGYEIKLAEETIAIEEKHIEQLKTNNEENARKINDQIHRLDDSISKEELEVEKIKGQVSVLAKDVEDKKKVEAKVTKLATYERMLEDKHRVLKSEIKFFEENDSCPTCSQEITGAFKQTSINNRSSELENVKSGLKLIEDDIKIAEERVAEIELVQNQIRSHQQSISRLQSSIQTQIKFKQELLSSLTSPVVVSVDNEANVGTLKEKLASLVSREEELVKEKQVLATAALLLKDTGIKTKIIKQYVPIMNKLINKYLAAMDFFVNFELNENFEETIKSRYRDEFSYNSFSEGEKLRIDLALLFTWRAIAKMRNSTNTNLLIMDEIFDSSLDSSGTDEFLKLLMSLSNETNILIISHKGDQLFDKFDTVIKFENVKNFSKIAA